jgi:Methyltransferase domain
MSEEELAFLHEIASSRGSGARVVEIGSWKGRSTVAICEGLRDGELYAVDTFAGDSAICPEVDLDPQTERDRIYEEFRANVAMFPFVTIMRNDSVTASGFFTDGSLDWIFIDGDHSFPQVRRDIRAWWPKLKVGGLLSGHDWGHVGVSRGLLTFWPAMDDVRDTVWTKRKLEQRLSTRAGPLVSYSLRERVDALRRLRVPSP